MIRYYGKFKSNKNHVVDKHEELVDSYNDLFHDSGINGRVKKRYTKLDRKINGRLVKRGSTIFGFSITTNYDIFYVCMVLVSLDNSIYFMCRSTLNKEIKKIHSAQSIKQCIKILKTKGTLK